MSTTLSPRLIALISSVVAYADLAAKPGQSVPDIRRYLRRVTALTPELRECLSGVPTLNVGDVLGTSSRPRPPAGRQCA